MNIIAKMQYCRLISKTSCLKCLKWHYKKNNAEHNAETIHAHQSSLIRDVATMHSNTVMSKN